MHPDLLIIEEKIKKAHKKLSEVRREFHVKQKEIQASCQHQNSGFVPDTYHFDGIESWRDEKEWRCLDCGLYRVQSSRNIGRQSSVDRLFWDTCEIHSVEVKELPDFACY